MVIDIRKGQKTIFAMLKRLPRRYSADDEFTASKTGLISSSAGAAPRAPSCWNAQLRCPTAQSAAGTKRTSLTARIRSHRSGRQRFPAEVCEKCKENGGPVDAQRLCEGERQ
jgi:hypothetical protein